MEQIAFIVIVALVALIVSYRAVRALENGA